MTDWVNTIDMSDLNKKVSKARGYDQSSLEYATDMRKFLEYSKLSYDEKRKKYQAEYTEFKKIVDDFDAWVKSIKPPDEQLNNANKQVQSEFAKMPTAWQAYPAKLQRSGAESLLPAFTSMVQELMAYIAAIGATRTASNRLNTEFNERDAEESAPLLGISRVRSRIATFCERVINFFRNRPNTDFPALELDPLSEGENNGDDEEDNTPEISEAGGSAAPVFSGEKPEYERISKSTGILSNSKNKSKTIFSIVRLLASDSFNLSENQWFAASSVTKTNSTVILEMLARNPTLQTAIVQLIERTLNITLPQDNQLPSVRRRATLDQRSRPYAQWIFENIRNLPTDKRIGFLRELRQIFKQYAEIDDNIRNQYFPEIQSGDPVYSTSLDTSAIEQTIKAQMGGYLSPPEITAILKELKKDVYDAASSRFGETGDYKQLEQAQLKYLNELYNKIKEFNTQQKNAKADRNMRRELFVQFIQNWMESTFKDYAGPLAPTGIHTSAAESVGNALRRIMGVRPNTFSDTSSSDEFLRLAIFDELGAAEVMGEDFKHDGKKPDAEIKDTGNQEGIIALSSELGRVGNISWGYRTTGNKPSSGPDPNNPSINTPEGDNRRRPDRGGPPDDPPPPNPDVDVYIDVNGRRWHLKLKLFLALMALLLGISGKALWDYLRSHPDIIPIIGRDPSDPNKPIDPSNPSADPNLQPGRGNMDPTLNVGTGSLRADELLGGEALLLTETARERKEEQARWDKYSMIQRGHGLGRNNPLFLENLRDERMRFAKLREPTTRRPLPHPPARRNDIQPRFIPIYQADYEFEDAYANEPLQHWTEEIPTSEREDAFENNKSIFFPEHALRGYKVKPVRIPQMRTDGQRFAPHSYEYGDKIYNRGQSYHSGVITDHVPYDNAWGFPEKKKVNPYVYALAKKTR